MDSNFHTEDGTLGFFKTLELQTNLKLFPVHRLDKVTSGLVITAKRIEIENVFNSLFQKKEIQKFYLAISDTKPKRKQGTIKGDMESSRNGTFKLSQTKANPALTFFKTTQFFENSISYRIFLFQPMTGRTHQLRVAAKSLGSPLLGDMKYKGTAADRTYLHAWKLIFTLNGKTFKFTAPPSQGLLFQSVEFKKKIKTWDSPTTLQWPQRK